MTARQEQLADLLYLRLCPLRRLYVQRLERMMAEDADLFDEGEYSEEAAKLIRLQALMDRISARLPAADSELDTLFGAGVAARLADLQP